MFGCDDNTNDCNYAWDDDNDHGTHCAGTADAVDDSEGVVGVSTEANLWAGKVLNGCGSGSNDNIAAGIEWAADQGFDVASMSLGGDSSSVVQDACQYAYDNGVLLVAAAGNDGECTDCVGHPAAYDTVIAVSATSEDDSLASFSSTGPEVELAAPGEDVLSTVPPESSSDGLDTFSGTSMACPHVSGAGAQLMANGYTNTEARSRLQETAEDIGLGDNEQGYGLLDAEAAVLDGSDDTNSAPTVDDLSASEVETDDSDAEFDVDWAVSDDDGNLDSVDLT
ncbi:MAG: S8 family peptidase, partial [Halanaeroarchaeum sp.]